MKTLYPFKSISLAILLSSLMLASVVSAEGTDDEEGGEEGPRMTERLMKQLNLNEEQRAQLADVRKGKREKMKELREKKRSTRERLHEAFKINSSDADLKKLHQEMQGLHAQLADARFESILAIRSILNDEQKKKFMEMKGEMGGHHKRRRGGWRKKRD